MKNIKDKTWYQILFVPSKGKAITYMTWLFIIAGIIGIISLFTSCQKDPVIPSTTVGKAQFTNSIITRNLKTSYVINYVKTIIDLDTLTLDVFYDNGVPYTTTFDISEGQHAVNSFIIYDSLNNVIGACPMDTSEYANLVDISLPINFNVQYAMVTNIPIDVIYEEANSTDITNFGYSYFTINTAYLRHISLFGLKGTPDSLLQYYSNSVTSDYAIWYHPVQELMHAQYWIHHLYKKGDEAWKSIAWYRYDENSQGYVYNIPYIDFENLTDSNEFKIEINTYWPVANGMSWVITGVGYYDYSIMAVDDSLISNDNGLTTFAYAPDSSWFPNIDYFFKWDW